MNNGQIKKLENDVKTEFINAGNELLGRDLRLVEESVRAVVEILNLADVSGSLPLTKEHQCFERGHAFYLVCEIDNGRSKYGDHKCSRCGHVESFQYDYGSW